MPSKKKKKNNNRRIVVTSLLLLVLVVCGTTIVTWKNKHEFNDQQEELESELHQTGLKLDSLKALLDDKVVGLSTMRDNYCREPGRKSGPKTIYCYQVINADIPELTDSEIIRYQKSIHTVLSENDVMNFEILSSTSNSGITNTKYTNEVCDAEIYTRLNGVHKQFPGSELTLHVTCSGGGEFDKYIYPALQS